MTLTQQIDEDMKVAMRAKDESALSTLRMLRAALKNKKIDVQHELTDEEVMTVVKSDMKKLREGLESYVAGGRADLAEAAKKEIATLEKYLPVQMAAEEVEKVVAAALAEAGITAKADMGRAMGAAMKAVAGRADGTAVKAAVEKLLV